MEQQFDNLRRSAYFHLRQIRRVRDLPGTQATRILVQSLVTSHLDYCNSLLVGLPSKYPQKLQRLQNSAARLGLRSRHGNSSSKLLRELHWLPIKEKIDFKMSLLAHKCINGVAPRYLLDLIPRHNPGRCLRSSSTHRLSTPRIRTSTYGDRAFSAAAPVETENSPL